MARVFVSYARIERPRAEPICRALEQIAGSVFYDLDTIDAGDDFPQIIQNALDGAFVVIGVWTNLSIQRPWVRRECMYAQNRGILVPVALETLHSVPPAFIDVSYEMLNPSSLGADDAWARVLRAIARKLENDARQSGEGTAEERSALAAAFNYAAAEWRRHPDEISAREAIAAWLETGLSEAADSLSESIRRAVERAQFPISPVHKNLGKSTPEHRSMHISLQSGLLPFDHAIAQSLDECGAVLALRSDDRDALDALLSAWGLSLGQRLISRNLGCVAYIANRTSEEVATQFLGIATGLTMSSIRGGKISKGEFELLQDAAVDLQNLPLHIDEELDLSVTSVGHRLQKLNGTVGPIQCVIVESLSSLNDSGELAAQQFRKMAETIEAPFLIGVTPSEDGAGVEEILENYPVVAALTITKHGPDKLDVEFRRRSDAFSYRAQVGSWVRK